jgi:hypothetical protein
VFGLATPSGHLVGTGLPQIWVAATSHDPPAGPFPARWETWTANEPDSTGQPPVPGFFVADLIVPQPGTWTVVATATDHGEPVSAEGAIPAVAHPPAAEGTQALSEPTPVATTPADAAKIDTRQPPSPLHYISLDAAMRNGHPTVLIFATPLLCQSRMCGPVVDEALQVYNELGPGRANFIHVEIYPERNPDRPAQQFLRWGFQSERWVIVIDRAGIIRARFEGPVVSQEIAAALQPLL